MATTLSTINLNGFNLQLSYDLLSQSVANNSSTVRLYVVMNVTTGFVSWNRGSAWVHTSGDVGIGTYYTTGSYTLLTRDYTFTHENDGTKTVILGFGINTTLSGGSGQSTGTIVLPRIARAAVINTFTGTDINKPFSATYTTRGTGFTYKLRISIPNVKALDTFNNYVSGSSVTLSKASIDYIKAYTTNKTVQLGGVIETWSGNSKIGESSEIKINCNIRRELYMRINGEYKRVMAYVRIGNEWKEARPYLRINSEWKEGI